MTQPTVAVTGATGHLGHHIVKELLSRDFKVRGLFLHNAGHQTHPNLSWVQGDITDPSSIKSLLHKVNIVIHAAGIVNVSKASRTQLLETNVLGTQNIVDYCTLLDRSIRLIHISSTSAVQPTKNNSRFTEKRPYVDNSELAYAWSKSMAEQLVMDAFNNKELDAIVIRPSAVIGPNDEGPSIFGQAILRLMREELIALTNGGYNFVDVRDASRAIVNAIELKQSGEIYNVGGKFYTVRSIGKIIRKMESIKIPKTTLPLWLILLIAPFIKWLKEKRGYPAPFNMEIFYCSSME